MLLQLIGEYFKDLGFSLNNIYGDLENIQKEIDENFLNLYLNVKDKESLDIAKITKLKKYIIKNNNKKNDFDILVKYIEDVNNVNNINNIEKINNEIKDYYNEFLNENYLNENNKNILKYVTIGKPVTYALIKDSKIYLDDNKNIIFDIEKDILDIIGKPELERISKTFSNLIGKEITLDNIEKSNIEKLENDNKNNNAEYNEKQEEKKLQEQEKNEKIIVEKENIEDNENIENITNVTNVENNNNINEENENVSKDKIKEETQSFKNIMNRYNSIPKEEILKQKQKLEEHKKRALEEYSKGKVLVDGKFKEQEIQESEKVPETNNFSKGNYSPKRRLEGTGKNIFGRIAADDNIFSKIEAINENSGDVIVFAEVINIDTRNINENCDLATFTIYDGTSSIVAKKFLQLKETETVISRIKEHMAKDGIFKIFGEAQYDNFSKEVTIKMKGMVEFGEKEVVKKEDDAEEKRIELRTHTQMSQLDGIIPVDDLFDRVKQYNMEAVAITDLGVVQAFPDAMNSAKQSSVTPIYGMDAILATDDNSSISFLRDADIKDTTYCILDIETTGLSFRTDKITEFGIMKVKNGEILDEFECFVNPEMDIPEEVVNITHITNEMVKDSDTIDVVMPKVIEFLGDSVLVAHNADFDIGFIKHYASLQGYELNNMYIDTLRLAKQVYPELKRFKLGRIADHIGVVVENAHRALDDVITLKQVFDDMQKRIIAKGILNWNELDEKWEKDEEAYKTYPMYNATILVTKQIGMQNLYKLVSYAHVNHYYIKPRVLKSLYTKHKEGLIIGSGNSKGELYSAIQSGKSDEELIEIAEFYDFLEVQPPENEMDKVRSGIFKDLEDAKKIVLKILEIGKRLGKKVVATGDVYFLDPEDVIYREILHVGQKRRDADNQSNLYFRTTNEMLEAFDFLDEEKAKEIVITNTREIYEKIDKGIKPISDLKCTPYIDGCEKTIKDITYNRAYELYGNPLPKIVEDRLEVELNSIISNGFSVMYIIAQKLVKKSNEDGYIVGSRGSVGSSLVAFMLGITEVNSLKAHYRCEKCKYSDFSDHGFANGFDMPDMECPKCGAKLIKDGMNIPFETFLGFTGNKEPDIDLNFSDEYQSTAHKYTEEIIGDGTTYKAGTIGTIAEKTAFGYVKGYFESKDIQKSSAEIARLAKGCTGVKRTTGQHPGGIIVVPAGHEIYEFCPVQKPADKSDIDIITTHFDYHKIDHNLLKLDMLGHLDPTMLKYLQDETGIRPQDIPLDDKDTMKIFSSTETIGVSEKDIGSNVGSIGVPEFGTKFVRGMLEETKPTTFEELIRISGLSHGTDVWLNNAQELIKNGTVTLSDAICTRDDIMTYLIAKGVPAADSFNIMEKVRKGKGITEEYQQLMRENDVPEWYIDSCLKIKYMFPKAHAAAYVTNAFRIAWFKVHKPVAYYANYYTVRSGGDFDATFMIFGKEKLEEKMKELEAMKNMGVKEKGVYSICELVREMYLRGIEFLPIDLYESHYRKFIVVDDTHILPPLSSIPGLGMIAAENIYNEAQKEKFFTKEEMKLRCKIGNSTMEMLENFGVVDGMLDTAQTSIFDMF